MTRFFPWDETLTQALPALVTMQIGPNTVRFTTAGYNVIIEVNDEEGVLYQPWPGADITGLQYPSDGTAANADVVMQAIPGSFIEPGMAARGLLDNWPITIELFDPSQLSAGTFIALAGTIGSCVENSHRMLTIAANGQLRLAAERSINEKYSLTCRATLGDDRCKVPICCYQDISEADIQRDRLYVTYLFNDGTSGLLKVLDAYGRIRTGVADTVEDYANVYYECTTQGTTAVTAPTYPTTPGDTVTDGTAVFTCRNAWSRYARGYAIDAYNIQLDALPDPRAAADPTWYAFGRLFVRSGEYGGYPAMQISEWDPVNNIVTLFLPIQMDDIPADTQFEIISGCDRTHEMCFTRYDNIRNGRMEFLVPPPETLMGL